MDSSNLQETLSDISNVIAQWEAEIKVGEALARMKQTDDYQLVFEQGYIGTEAKKLFDILTDPSGASCYTAEQIHLKLEAVSHFKGYVGTEVFPGTVESDARYAAESIQREQDHRATITAEYAEEE